MANSVSGPMLRASGVAWDIRKADPYAAYDKVDFDIAVGVHGDAYDGFVVRLVEMRQSVKILDQTLDLIPAGPVPAQLPTSPVQSLAPAEAQLPLWPAC